MRRLSTLAFGRRAAAALGLEGSELAAILDTALVVDPLDTLDACESAIFFLLGPIQSFKSAAGQLHLARNHVARSTRAAWYGPSVDFIKSFADEKLVPLLWAHPELSPDPDPRKRGLLVHDDRNRFSRLVHTFATGSSRLLSAQTENDRTGKSYKHIYCDETHLYEPGWIQQIQNRRASYPDDFKEVHMSTGLTVGDTVAGGEAAALWSTTDQRLWHVRCPHCQKLFEPRYLHREKEDDPESPIIGGLIYTRAFLENGLPDETAIASGLVYQCPRCRVARLPDRAGSRVLLSGTAHRPHGIYISQNPAPYSRRFGWNWNAIALRPWLPIVVKFEKAQLARSRGDIEPLGLWIREEIGGLWNPEQHLQTKRARAIGDYIMGSEWIDKHGNAVEARDDQGRPVRALTCDVQRDYFVPVARMWSRGHGSRLRFAAKVSSPGEVRDLQLAHGIIDERVYLDGRHDTEFVRRICARYGWRVLLGDNPKEPYHHTATGLRRIFSEPRIVDAYAGTVHQGQPIGRVAQFNFDKQSTLSRLQIIRTLIDTTGAPLWTAAKDAPEWYWKEIDAHYRKKNKDDTWEWTGLHEDHAGDCEAMQIVFASMAGLIGSESLETTAQQPATPPA